MSSSPPLDKRAAARELIAARARRVGAIRRRVTAAALATFALAWGVIAWHGSMGTTSVASASAQSASGDAPAAGTQAWTAQPGSVTTAQS